MKENKAFSRCKILDAAMQVFIQHGYAAADLDDVARLAGVAKGTIYLHFENKACLFERMIDNWIEAYAARYNEIPTDVCCADQDEYKSAVHRWSRSLDLTGLTEVWMLVLSRSFEFPQLLGRLFQRAVVPCAASVPLPGGRKENQLPNPGTFSIQLRILSLSLLDSVRFPTVADAMLELVWASNEAAG